MENISISNFNMDYTFIHNYLKRSYWSKGISYSDIIKKVDNSFSFALLKDTQQIGFARVVTDYISFAYLADVFIIEEERGKSYSKKLIEFIVNHPKLKGIDRFMLATEDAHGLYKQFGFKHMDQAELFMYKLGT